MKHCRPTPGAESLERRDVPSAVGGVPFASTPGQISRPGQAATIVFRVEPGHVVSDRSIPALLGLDAEPAPGSKVQPKVVSITSLSGRLTHGTPTPGGPLLTNVAIPLKQATLYQVKVVGRHGTTGPFVLNAFLPGDVNGDGVVDRVDLGRVRHAYGAHRGGRRYDPGADFNNDGRIGHVDLGVTKRNLGTRASVIVLSTGTPVE